MVSAERPAAPVIALAPDAKTARRLTLCWGVVALVEPARDPAALVATARRIATDRGLAETGDFLLLVHNPVASADSEAPTVTVVQV